MNGQPLSDEQRALLTFLLEREFPGRAELAEQAQSVTTEGRSCSCGCPSFSLLVHRSLPPALVGERMVSDAHGTDPGGNEVGVLLFTEDGYLTEVEVYSSTGNGFDGLPPPESLQLSEWSDPDENGARWLANP